MEEILSKIQLPEHWSWVELKDLTENPKNDIVDGPFGSNLKSEEYIETGIPVFKIQNIKENKFVDKNINFISPSKAEEISRHSFQKGDLIITKLGNPLGLCCKVPDKYPYGIIVADLIRFRPSHRRIFVQYLIYAINNVVVQNQFKAITKGTTRPRVNLTIVRGINVPLPPLPEQRAIVSKIEQLFSELDNGIANLRLAQEQLKVYRQAVLKKAFEGELTRKWREQQTDLPDAQDLLEQIRIEREEAAKVSGKKVKPVNPLSEDEIAKLPELAEGWRWVKFGEACDKIFDGTHFSPKNNPTGDYKYITAKNIKEGYLDLTNISYVTKKDHSEIYSRCDVKKGDVLYIKDGATTGKACVNPLEEEFSLLSSVGVFRVNEKNISPKYIEHYLNAEVTRHQMLKNIAGVAITRLTLVKLTNSALVLPPLPEQHAIVQEIETRLSVCDKMAQDIEEALEKAEALRQSILKKAFEGKLLNERELAEVRRAEDWEPAEVLLERIRAERAGNGKR